MSNTLLVIDVQQGFITDVTAHIPTKVLRLLRRNVFDHVAFTQFVNLPGSFFETRLDWNKMKQSPEIDIVHELRPFATNCFVKYSYSCLTPRMSEFIASAGSTKVFLVGLETDICVLKTATDAIEAGLAPYVVSDCCATTAGPAVHSSALGIIGRFIGRHNVVASDALNEIIFKEG